VSPIVSDLGLARGDTVLAFVNGMGGTPLIELYVAFNSVAKLLAGKGITIGRSLVGNYITSLEMAGFSVTLLRLDDELTRWWDAPVHTPALRWGR
jgi:dihydroxyacetone kinase-like protein